MTDPAKPLVGVIMGSRSDWVTMEHCATTLEELGVPHEVRIVSAHRTPDWLMEYAGTAEARGLQVIIAAAGGAAHLPGMAASKTVLPVLGVPPEHWQRGLDAWPGIPHRLERLGEVGGVAWFNDSKATNVDAAVTAVRSFERGVHLIAGGRGKGASYAPLAEAARGRVAALYTIGEDAPALASAFAGVTRVVDAGDLATASARAMDQAQDGDVVLLSPACASFDQFPNFQARGDALRAALPQEVEIELWDERFSTAAAERTLLEADMSRRRRKAHVDAVAAQFILQGWLDGARVAQDRGGS